MSLLTESLLFEHGDSFYLVGPVAPLDLKGEELDELAFAKDLKAMAPNEHLVWMRGQYVEADRPNENGDMWSADDLAIKSLTPMLMPVTVMHDPRTAVGLIADTRLLTPAADNVPRARIDNTIGLWGHRFPDVVEEAMANYRQGGLMQSMECRPSWYDCGDCGRRFPKLPGGAEKANWCDHLRGVTASAANGKPVRRLGDVCFTGTGLIYESRGARGALDTAQLEVFQDTVAEYHEKAHRDSRKPPPRRAKNTMEIDDKVYQDLLAAQRERDDLTTKVATLEETAAKVPDLEKKVDETETAKVAAEKDRDDLKKKVDDAEEKARAATLAGDRLDKLGKGFTARFGDSTLGRLKDQAGSLSDEDWEARIVELEETASKLSGDEVKRDDGAEEATDPPEGGDVIARTDTSKTDTSNGHKPGSSSEPTAAGRRSIVSGLVKQVNG